MTHQENDSIWDLIVVWVGTILGHFTLSSAVLWVTLIYTLVRLYVIIRNEILERKK